MKSQPSRETTRRPPPPLAPEEFTALLASIVYSSDDAIMAKSPEGIITSWNRGSEALYGYKAEEIIGKSGQLLVHPDRPLVFAGHLADGCSRYDLCACRAGS